MTVGDFPARDNVAMPLTALGRGAGRALLLLSLVGSACTAGQQIVPRADLVLRGGNVITVDAQGSLHETVAIVGNRIAAVGSSQDIEPWIGPSTEVFELDGKSLLPGFIDAHNHVEHTARSEHLLLRVHSPPLASSADVLQKVEAKAAELAAGSWILGQGTYGQEMPSKQELDRVAPDHPVVLRWSMHRQIANQKALEASGVDARFPDPPGGRIDRGADGLPTGVFRESFDVFPIPPFPYDELREAIRETLAEIWMKQGVTTVYALPASTDAVRAFQQLRDEDRLPVRIQLSFTAAPGHQALGDMATILALGIRSGMGDDWLRIGAIKIFVDGDGEAAATYRREREGAANFGLTRSVAQLNSDVVAAHRAGWQLWLHAIGDKAQDLALDAFEAALEARPDDDHRHRMEHLGNYLADEAGEATLARARELGVIPVPTAAFMWGSRPRRPDSPSTGSRYPFAKLLEMGFRPPGNADSAGTQTFSINPLFSLTREVLRTNRDGEPIDPEQAISPLDAIRMHTIWAARAGFEDDIKGSIEPGKLADLVVLTEDPLTAPERLMEMRVDATIIDGVIRYRRAE